jgi:hypothetical protein
VETTPYLEMSQLEETLPFAVLRTDMIQLFDYQKVKLPADAALDEEPPLPAPVAQD